MSWTSFVATDARITGTGMLSVDDRQQSDVSLSVQAPEDRISIRRCTRGQCPLPHTARQVVYDVAVHGWTLRLQDLAAQDFAQLGGALAAGARLRALLPSGQREWTGAE
jgi:hypothetical protein